MIPFAIGGSLVIDRVCKDCNDRLGQHADAGLVRQYQIEQRRIEHNLKGQSGAVPDPLKRALKQPAVSTEDPAHKVLLRARRDGGGFDAKIIPIVEFDVRSFPGKLYRIECKKCYLDPAETDIESIVKNALRKAGLQDEKAIEESWGRFSKELTLQEQHLTFQSVIKANMGGHQLGVLKIAYEMTWYWLGDLWLDDQQAVVMRSALRGEAPLMQAAIFDPGRYSVQGYDTGQTHLNLCFRGWESCCLLFGYWTFSQLALWQRTTLIFTRCPPTTRS